MVAHWLGKLAGFDVGLVQVLVRLASKLPSRAFPKLLTTMFP